jgi:tetratricopeptide (TPR) repeat protein
VLGQVYATWITPLDADKVTPLDASQSGDPERERMEYCYKRAHLFAEQALSPAPRPLWKFWLSPPPPSADAAALARNAQALAEMNFTDFFLPKLEKLRRLGKALEWLKQNFANFPFDSDYRCDLASCHLRIGMWSKDTREFDKADQLLCEVTRQLHENYGFALFERGRIARLRGNFPEAMGFFENARAIGERLRNVTDARVEREIALTQEQSANYP